MRLLINVIKAILTHDTQIGSKMDPFVVLKLGTDQQTSKILEEGGDMPQWNQQFTFNVKQDYKQLHLIVYDQDMTVNDLVGQVKISISDIISQKNIPPKWYSLKYDIKKPAGKIMLGFSVQIKPNQQQFVEKINKNISNTAQHIHPIGLIENHQRIHSAQKTHLHKIGYSFRNNPELIRSNRINYQPNNFHSNDRNQQNVYLNQQNIYSNNVIYREIPVKNQTPHFNNSNNSAYGYIVQPQKTVRTLKTLPSENGYIVRSVIPENAPVNNSHIVSYSSQIVSPNNSYSKLIDSRKIEQKRIPNFNPSSVYYQQPIQNKIVHHRNIVPHNEYSKIYAPKTFVYKPQSISQISIPNNVPINNPTIKNNTVYSSIS